MRIIDSHHHLYDEPDYGRRLIRTMDELGIEKACLSGLGSLFHMADDEAVARAVAACPDRLVGFVSIRPGFDTPAKIRKYHDLGFLGVKTTCPSHSYDAKEYHDLWATASSLNMPVLFHTGIVTAPGSKPSDDISSDRMRPGLIEPIARAFPDMNLIMAHCGVSFSMEASDIIRLVPNVYCDISGSSAPTGWRRRLSAELFHDFFWWPGAWEKILFGTDVHWRDMAPVLEADHKRYEASRLDHRQQEMIFAGTVRRLLGLD